MELGDQLNVVLCKQASGLREAAPGCWVEELSHIVVVRNIVK